MSRHFLLLSLAALLLVAPAALAQGTSYLRRSVAVQPELQAELAASQHSYAYLALGGLRYTDYSSYGPSRPLGLDVRYLAAGYEQQFAAEAWSWGATLRVASMAYVPAAVQPGLLLRHISHLGPLVLGQRLGAEVALTGDSRLDPAYTINSPYEAASRLLLRLRLDLHPQGTLHVSNWLAVSPRMSFEPALFLRLQRDTGDPDKRTIDYTGLRADMTLRFSKIWLDATLLFALQTRYQRTLIQIDSNGNPTSNGKLNTLLPTVGLELRYRLHHAIYTEGGFELPSQH